MSVLIRTRVNYRRACRDVQNVVSFENYVEKEREIFHLRLFGKEPQLHIPALEKKKTPLEHFTPVVSYSSWELKQFGKKYKSDGLLQSAIG